jgi:hypothetical protein
MKAPPETFTSMHYALTPDQAKQALRGACLVLRSVTSGDDLRRDFSCAYDNVKVCTAY